MTDDNLAKMLNDEHAKWYREYYGNVTPSADFYAVRPTFDLFDITWAVLAQLGACDALGGGGEYGRIRREWLSYPENERPDLPPFIIDRANMVPPEFTSNYQPPADVYDEDGDFVSAMERRDDLDLLDDLMRDLLILTHDQPMRELLNRLDVKSFTRPQSADDVAIHRY